MRYELRLLRLSQDGHEWWPEAVVRVKMWLKKDSWVSYAACGGDPRHTAETLTEEELAGAVSVCGSCLVRPECISWALREEACSVIVAGVLLPDPIYKKELRCAYTQLQESLEEERERRGEF